MLYIGGPKNLARKLLEMIKNVSKVAEYKINVENSVTVLNISKKHTKKEIIETLPFTVPWNKQPKKCKNKPSQGCGRALY